MIEALRRAGALAVEIAEKLLLERDGARAEVARLRDQLATAQLELERIRERLRERGRPAE